MPVAEPGPSVTRSLGAEVGARPERSSSSGPLGVRTSRLVCLLALVANVTHYNTMASVKIAALALKTLSKPIAARIKMSAKEHESFRQGTMRIAQVSARRPSCSMLATT